MKTNITTSLLAAAVLALGAMTAIAPAQADEVIATGTFEGRSDHRTDGEVTIIKTDSGYQVVLSDDFSLDGAPDPTLAFGKDGFASEAEFTELKSNDGHQVYDLPEGLDPTDYDEFYVWCSEYAVPLGFADQN